MSLEIYWISGSPYSWRVFLALAIKQLEYQSRLLEYTRGDTETSSFLQMNPRGLAPVLKNGSTVIYESVAILAYLDSKYPDIPLFGTSPEETGKIWQAVMEHENYVRDTFYNVFMPLWSGEAETKASRIKASAKQAHDALSKIETSITKTGYLVGDSISAADVVLFPGIQCLLNALAREDSNRLELDFLPLENHYPKIVSWIERIESIPGYGNTYPPHWKT
jgi:glutathione S-transferase